MTQALTVPDRVTRSASTLPGPLAQSWRITQRHGRELLRQPSYLSITLIQPILWIVLFGSLFSKVVDIPGFPADDYLVFLTPGVIIMTALFSSSWSGMGIIEDLDRGIMDRFLVVPVRRSSLLNGRLVTQSLTIAIQSVIILGLAYAMGARFDGGVVGLLVLLGTALLLGILLSSASHALALTLRTRESVIAASQAVVLPLTFLSGTFMSINLAPGWIQNVAKVNPVEWAVTAGRSAALGNPDWGAVWSRLGVLTVLAVAMAALATRAFRSYQASI